MNISVKINSVDRTNEIIRQSLEKRDVLNERKDTLKFTTRKYASKTFQPKVGDTVELINNSITEFKGIVLSVTKQTESHKIVRYDVECVDYSHNLGRILVTENFTDTTIEEIIDDVITDYASEFTTTNVSANLAVKSIKFNRISVLAVIEKLARLSNHSWYVDKDKDIHFFAKNTETAPFNLTDNSDNYIYDSLEVSDDISQLRNRVFIRGGKAEGATRTETFDGDANKTFFSLSNKFSKLPTVKIGTTTQTVGVDFLDKAEDFDALWNYQESYIKFTNAPGAGSNNISVTGIPLYSILVQVENPTSIAEYGVYEFSKTDTSIKSKEEAKEFALAELSAYAQKISEGSFSTYTEGLRSGQTIRVNSTQRDINETFLIQEVSFRLLSQDKGVYKVKLATLKSISLIDFLIDQLRRNDDGIEEDDNTVLERFIQSSETITLSEEFTAQPLNYAVTFHLTPQAVTGTKRPFILSGSLLQ